MKGNPKGNINEITAGATYAHRRFFDRFVNYDAEESAVYLAAAYDFLNTDSNNFNVRIWYNSSFSNEKGDNSRILFRVSRSVNLVKYRMGSSFRRWSFIMLLRFSMRRYPMRIFSS